MADVQLSPTAQKVLTILQQHAGTPHTPSDVCEVVDCSTSQAHLALEALANAGLVARQRSASGAFTYVART